MGDPFRNPERALARILALMSIAVVGAAVWWARRRRRAVTA
jgi:hypothetical protein